MSLTSTQRKLLWRLDKMPQGQLNDYYRHMLPGVHFCPDWDYMPVCDDSPEIEGCTCERNVK